jgi:hypothetical protein
VIVAYTSFTHSGLARALTLARGLKARHPQWRLVGVLVDGPAPPEEANWRGAFDLVIEAEALYGESWRRFVFKHEAAEACAAVKARALRRLFAEGAEKAIYFSPDIAVFDDLGALERRLDEASILLTPHLLEPNETPQAIADNEGLALAQGVYNLGFLGVRNDASGAALAAWWAGRLDAACHVDTPHGLYLDQRYFDLAPALFERVETVRDPGCHVAAWNLSRRRLEIAADGRILVNGEATLKFYHFGGDFGDDGWLTERYAGRRLAPYELWAWRKRALAAAGAPPARGWAYGVFDDGAPIGQGARRLYRSDPELETRFPDPFAAGPDSFRAYVQKERPDLG